MLTSLFISHKPAGMKIVLYCNVEQNILFLLGQRDSVLRILFEVITEASVIVF